MHKKDYINDVCKTVVILNLLMILIQIHATYYLFVLKRLKKNYNKVYSHFNKKKEKI